MIIRSCIKYKSSLVLILTTLKLISSIMLYLQMRSIYRERFLNIHAPRLLKWIVRYRSNVYSPNKVLE